LSCTGTPPCMIREVLNKVAAPLPLRP